MAYVVDDGDDAVGRGLGSTLGVVLAILLVLAVLVGGWWLFVREPVDAGSDTTIEDTDINIDESGDATSP